ncbi:MAG: hypothetical protein IT329_02415 [Caldilineaceae bacterium]|nr:hypothetical protein [Caldilineaceae bacterium]
MTRPLAWLLRGLLGCLLNAGCIAPLRPVSPLQTPYQGPLVPTPPVYNPVRSLDPAPPVRGLPTQARPTPAPPPPPAAPGSLRWRIGVGVPDGRSPLEYPWPADRPGWYLNWSVGYTTTTWLSPPEALTQTSPLTPVVTLGDLVIPDDALVGMYFAPMVRVDEGDLAPPAVWLAATARLLPGRTWLIGNEPDVRWQDNTPAAAYARAYHAAYTAIKQADPSAQVAIGGVSQITPLRLAYLDDVRAVYRAEFGVEMPVDVWNMHAFVLQEKAGGWGVDVPPGMKAESGETWGIDDHDNLALVELQVRRMRGWMQAHGQQDKPLWITEYGILMPAEYGFTPERVRRFMIGSFELLRSLRDPELGYPADGYRLVQRWVWFSAGDRLYPTGDLFTPAGDATPVMDALAAYLTEFAQESAP